MKSRSLVEAYFKAWNDHDLSQLERVLHKGVKLIDWDLDVYGLGAVLDANAKIFADHPNIYATPLNIVLNPSGSFFWSPVFERRISF